MFGRTGLKLNTELVAQVEEGDIYTVDKHDSVGYSVNTAFMLLRDTTGSTGRVLLGHFI